MSSWPGALEPGTISLPELPPPLQGAAAVTWLAQRVVVTVMLLPITFVCNALSDWITTQPERTTAPTVTATAARAMRWRRPPGERLGDGLVLDIGLMLCSFFRGPIRPVRDPWMGASRRLCRSAD